ncbi:flippase [Methanolobus profundi]|uniref:Membrane protein involved in the export of O-antigen and teichoic acid n=1 Tax=Methanolobus profundi TaxID=487685 RepID=A0A1I4RX78_9EURY|nr:flippase [Methanolobus profundi]SFM56886.1 Membrane protein involved in the export of O-antigen and teichoic acid [Methanolobus profundi]
MKTARKVATNTTAILFGNIVVKGLALLISINLARYLGVEYFGEYNFVITYLSLFVFLANFGLDSILIRDISRNKFNVNIFVSNVLMIRILTSLLSIILAITVVYVLDYPAETIMHVSLLSLILLFQGLSYLFESVFHGNLKMHYSSISMVVSKLFYALAVFILIILDEQLISFFYLYVITEFIRALISIYYSRKFVSIRMSIDLKLCKYLLKECIPFIVGYALLIIYYRIDILMLSKMEGNIAVGLYSAAYKLTDPLLFIPGALVSVLMPIMSANYVNNRPKLKQVYSLGSKYIFQLMLFISCILYVKSSYIFQVLYTVDYYSAILTFQILSLTVIFNSLNSIQNSLLVASNRQKINTVSVGFCCILNVALNLILIPIYNYNGAAIATLVSVFILFAIEFLFIRAELSLSSLNRSSYKIVLASLVVCIFLSNILDFNFFVGIIVCSSAYILILYVLGSISKDDILLFKSLLVNASENKP